MTDTMIEKMARAIGAELYGYVDPNDTPNTWASASAAARTALLALRDGLDEATIEATLSDSEYGYGSFFEPFQNAINHVLKEGEKA